MTLMDLLLAMAEDFHHDLLWSDFLLDECRGASGGEGADSMTERQAPPPLRRHGGSRAGYSCRLTPTTISMMRTTATSQSTAAQNGGHHLVLATNWRRCCQ